MKRTLSLIFAILIVGSMFALDFDWDGEFRSRAAAYNDYWDNPGGHVDNRLRMGFNTEFHPNFNLRAKFDIQNVWGNDGGEVETNGINVKTEELYIDMMVEALKSRVIVGQQPWSDHRALVMDDTFSGLSLIHEFSNEMNLMAAYGKYEEGLEFDRYDDTQGFLFSFNNEADLSYGGDLFFTWARRRTIPNDPYVIKNFSLAPYINMKFDPIVLDGTVIFQLNDEYDVLKDEVNTDANVGVAVNVSGDMEPVEWNVDLLFLGEHDLYTLSDYYQNNLYLFGYGEHHDGLGLYPLYVTTEDSYLGFTGQAKFALSEKIKFFGAFGFVNGTGIELNGGMEYQLVPDLLGLAAYGAYGIIDEDMNDENAYAVGTTLKLSF